MPDNNNNDNNAKPNNNAKDDYIATLTAELARSQAEKEALVAEFSKSIESGEFSPQDLREKFHALLPKAYARLTDILDNAESEAVQLSAIKFVFGIGVGQVKITDENDPDTHLANLIESLTNKDGAGSNTGTQTKKEGGNA